MKYASDIFSYWIITWFLIYIILRQYNINIPSPKFLIFLGIIINTYTLIKIILNNNPFNYIIKFIIVIIITKLIPFYFVYKDKIKVTDILYSILLFLIYLLYVFIRYQNPLDTLSKSQNRLITNKADSPIITLLNKLF